MQGKTHDIPFVLDEEALLVLVRLQQDPQGGGVV
jgi:hypothetical protein